MYICDAELCLLQNYNSKFKLVNLIHVSNNTIYIENRKENQINKISWQYYIYSISSLYLIKIKHMQFFQDQLNQTGIE